MTKLHRMVHKLAQRHPKAAHLSRRGMAYLRTNVWSVLPGISAMLVLVVLRQTMFLADTCPPSGSLDGNPLFCADGTVVATMLDHTLQDIKTSLAPATQAQPTLTQVRDAAQAEEAAAQDKAVADAAVAQAKAEFDLPGLDATAKQAAQDRLSTATVEQSKAATENAERHRDHTLRQAAAAHLSQAHAAIFREARARLRWIGSYGAVVAFSLATMLATAWIWGVAVEDHLHPEKSLANVPRTYGKGLAGLAVLLPASVVVLALVWEGFYRVMGNTVFSALPLPPPFSMPVLHFDDAITTFIFGLPAGTGGTFLPKSLVLVTHASLLVFIAVTLLGIAVGATLYQTPWQVSDWKTSLAAQPPPTETPYERFIIRCFQRLNVCIYIGATLLVLCVMHVSAQYSWVAALLDPGATDEPWKTVLPTAINGLADEMAFQYGLAFSTVLIALFLPTWVILRRRAWALARAQNPADPTKKGIQAFLEARGMGFTNVQQYTQILALLAPAGAGVFVSILKALSGGGS